MGAGTTTDRRTILLYVREGIARLLTPDLVLNGFRWLRRDTAYRRDKDGVVSEFRLGISSRPPALGRVGILVEPRLVVSVPAWKAAAEQRLADGAKGSAPFQVLSDVAVWELLDVLVPGDRPHWTLPDVPVDDDIEALGGVLSGTLTTVVLPFFDRVRTPDRVLRAVEHGDVRLLDGSRFTLACGAMLHDRPDLAAAILAPIGTARRQPLVEVLGLPAG